MLKYKEYKDINSFLSEGKLLHLEHLDDNILNLGLNGAYETIDNIKNVLDYISNNQNDKINIQIKQDGSPAIIAGYLNDKFFIGTKSVFNKNSKAAFSKEDIKNFYKPELQKILLLGFDYLPEVIPDGAIYQGDLMFTYDSLKKMNINGVNYLTYKPNTILYAIKEDSKFAKYIKSKKLGIAFHTEYIGDDIHSLNASVLLSDVKSSKNVYAFSTTIKAMPKLLDDSLKNDILDKLKTLQSDIKNFNKSDVKIINDLGIIPDVKAWYNFNIKNNSMISKGNIIKDLLQYLEYKNNQKLQKLKTDASKARNIRQFKERIKQIRRVAGTLYYMILWKERIREIKDDIIKILDKLKELEKMKMFINDGKGYRSTTPEGYVVIDKSGKMIKYVNRLEFSLANFLTSQNR